MKIINSVINSFNSDGSFQKISDPAFVTHNNNGITFVGFAGVCTGLSGTVDITFSINGKSYYGTITHTF